VGRSFGGDRRLRGGDTNVRRATDRSRRTGPWLQAAYCVLPLAIGVPVLVGIGISLSDLFSVRSPQLGWAAAIASDGRAMALGHFLYANPAHSYTGEIYPPLFPLVLGPLYRMSWWDGWPVLVSIVSGLALAGIAGSLAAGPRARTVAARVGQLAAVLGIAGLSWWIVSANPASLLFDAKPDEFAWFLALSGLILVARDVTRRRLGAWPAILLLSASFWAKQDTIAAIAAALLVVTWLGLGHRCTVPRPTWIRFAAKLALLNAAIFVALWLLTDGWSWFFLITLPARETQTTIGLGPYTQELRDLVLVPFLLVVLAAVAALLPQRLRRARGENHLRPLMPRPTVADGAASDATVLARHAISFERVLVLLLVVFAIVAVPVGLAGRSRQGGGPNMYIGLIWALTFLFALSYRRARCTRTGTVALITILGLLTAAAYVGPLGTISVKCKAAGGLFCWYHGTAVPGVSSTAHFQEFSPAVLQYAAHNRVYVPTSSGLTAKPFGEVWPSEMNILDLLAAGQKPSYLIDALLSRHFDAVAPFNVYYSNFASASGRVEDNFLWKLDRVVAAGYAPAPGVPHGLLVRRRGPNLAARFRSCFGPFALSHSQWDTRTNGGLWCRTPGVPAIQLIETPQIYGVRDTDRSELRSLQPVQLTGQLRVEFDAPSVHVEVRVATGRGRLRVRIDSSSEPGTLATAVQLPSGVVRTGRIVATPTSSGRLSVQIVFGRGPIAPGQLGVQVSHVDDASVSIFAKSTGEPLFDFSRLTTVSP
jgi:hypothetical protein